MAGTPVNGNAVTAWIANWLNPRRIGFVRSLLVFVPITAGLRWIHASEALTFLSACLAIIPLAGLIGESTERLAENLGAGIGGLLNATFGNAAELIIALIALSKGLDEVVKASITGSIIGNLLLVLGASIFAGGMKFPVQRFNRTAAGVGGTMMALAACGVLVPALFHQLAGAAKTGPGLEHKLSVAVSIVLLMTYGLNLIFTLGTHKDLYKSHPQACDLEREQDDVQPWGVRMSSIVLLVAAVCVAWMSEILVSVVEPAGHSLGISKVFMGVILVAIIGNAAEHSTAILMARKNQMDLAVGIAVGSALQIALFVAPVLVLASHLRSVPMDLEFSALEVVAVILAVVLARMVAEDGESNWLEGAMLLVIYAILGLAFFYLPESRVILEHAR